MSAPKHDLTACVEAGAQAAHARQVPSSDWDTLEPIVKHQWLEHYLPCVLAVLAVVEAGE